MKNKIRVEYDFAKKEPYVSLHVSRQDLESATEDLRDQAFQDLTEQANDTPISFRWCDSNPHFKFAEIRLITKDSGWHEKTILVDTFKNFAKQYFNDAPGKSDAMDLFQSFFDKIYETLEPKRVSKNLVP